MSLSENDKETLPVDMKDKNQIASDRFSDWMSRHNSIARFSILVTGLTVYFIILPARLRVAFWNSLQTHRFLAGMLVVFSLIAVSLVWSTGQKIDAWAFSFFNMWRSRPAWLDRLMTGFTQLGNINATLVIALGLYLASDHLGAYELLLGTITLWIVVELIKFLVHRSRPFTRLAQARIVGYRPRGLSFPSGHTSQTFFIATLMVQHFHVHILAASLLYIAAFLVGITRMYVGAHYPRDVLAGAILGTAWGLIGVIVDTYIFGV